MKKTIITGLLLLISCISVHAQDDVKSQSEIIKEGYTAGFYPVVVDAYRRGVRRREIVELRPEKNQPNEHFQIMFKNYPDSRTESKKNKVTSYFPDNIAFPVTYIENVYEGNKKLQKKIGYSIRRGSHIGKKRIVFVKNHIYFLTDWKSKDKYNIDVILRRNNDAKKEEKPKKKKKKGFGGLFKAMKQKASGISGESAVKLVKEELQPYLDKGFEKQKTYYETWLKNPKNAKTAQYIEDLHKAMQKGMKDYNQAIFDSPEYKRIMAHLKWMEKNINMTVQNNKGRAIWVGSSPEASITNKIDSGSSRTETCTSDMYYYYSSAKGSPGTKFYSAKSGCGGTVTIN